MWIINKLRKKRLRKKWRLLNKHNDTFVINDFDFNKIHIGRYTYGGLYVLSCNERENLYIGDFCSIATGVVFVLSADHYVNHISTFPFKVKALGSEKNEAISKGDIVIDDDVWIGQNAIIMSGVHIGQGAVIAAGAVVTKDVCPYEIVGGIPARKIKSRFPDELITELMKIDYQKLTKEQIAEHIDDLYEEFVDKCQLSWMPQRNT